AEATVERQQMIAADEQRELHAVVVVEGCSGEADCRRRVAAALHVRVSLHAADSTDSHGRVVEASGANEQPHVRDQAPGLVPHEHAVVGRRPLQVPARASGGDLGRVDRRRERLQRAALVVAELRHRLQLEAHYPRGFTHVSDHARQALEAWRSPRISAHGWPVATRPFHSTWAERAGKNVLNTPIGRWLKPGGALSTNGSMQSNQVSRIRSAPAITVSTAVERGSPAGPNSAAITGRVVS